MGDVVELDLHNCNVATIKDLLYTFRADKVRLCDFINACSVSKY